jgi:hypothetical protein
VSEKTVATSASGEARTRSSVSTAGRYTSLPVGEVIDDE